VSSEERNKIIEILAYRYAEICKANGVHHDSDYNWKRAEEMLKIDNEINGENSMLFLLNKDDENE
jgi:hypothetical protein